MTFMLNGNYLSVLSITLKDNKSEQEAMSNIRGSVKTFYGISSPGTPLKAGTKSWTNDQIWKFYVIQDSNNSYSGVAKTLLMDKKIPKSTDFSKYFFNSPTIEIQRITSAEEFEILARELM
jgi:hypothetical protein